MAQKKGCIPWNKGLTHEDDVRIVRTVHTEESKGKLRQARLGEKNPFWGKKHSEETRKKISIKGRNRKLTEEHKRKIGEAHIGKKQPESAKKYGENHHNWKGGITTINHKIRTSIQYTDWRTSVFERDNYLCVIGGDDHSNRLQADHIKPLCIILLQNKIDSVEKAINCDELWDLDNGRTLCEDCHRKTETWGRPSELFIKMHIK